MKSQKKMPKKRAPKKAKQPLKHREQEPEDPLDAALRDSFPASDPIAMTEPAADHDEEARRLLQLMGMPFRQK